MNLSATELQVLCRRSLVVLPFVCALLLVSSRVVSTAGDAGPAEAAGPPEARATENKATFARVIRPFLQQHCVRCHGPQKTEGKLRLDTLNADFDADTEAWVEVMDRMNLGEMPPAGEPRPAANAHRQVVRWIAGELKAAEQRRVAGGGEVLLRRMNRAEYSNTIRDLFHLKYLPGEDPAELLPPDAAYDGFRKVSSRLLLDPSLLGNFYEAARRVAELAIVTGPQPYQTHLSHFEMEDMAKPGSGFSYVCGHSGCDCGDDYVRLLTGYTRTGRGLLYPGSDRMIPVKGFYTIRVRAAGDPGDGDEPVRMYVQRTNGREGMILETDVTASLDEPQVYSVTLPLDALPEAQGVYMTVGIANGAKRAQPGQKDELPRAIGVGLPDFFDFDKAMKAASSAGNHAEALRLAARRQSEGWTGGTRAGQGLLDPGPLRKLYIDWIEIEGPLYEQWPPRSHQELFFRDRNTPQTVDYAREIFTRFLPRAFRRPVTEQEIADVVGLVQAELERGTSFEQAIGLGVTYILTTPSFLYLAEPAGDDAADGISDYELASRLSYFLWSSMPDDRLFELAAAGRLHKPELLRQEVDRMLRDSRSQALVDGFAAQWLRTDEFLEFQPDQKIYREFYRDYNPQLRQLFVRETHAFFEEILRNDLSLLNFLDSDFVMVNGPLAEFYGLPGVEGSEFRRVPLPADSPRGGLLGQAGIHLRGSDGIRTKPVNRGVYLLEVLFNDPPDPPPPNVGEVEPNIEGRQLTVRDRLLQHQQIEACASCHRGIDPYGLALENFDITGAWRERQNGEDFRGASTPPIDASGQLPNGRPFADFEEFKTLLVDQSDRFRRAFAEKLFLYALGRPATAADRGTIDQVASAMEQQGDSLRAAMQALVVTEAFRAR
ncbi:MAG: DUF1592 domain-containing protein [Planctomycetaceae bacterium]|nr:DUF1592 domain-containing protein [Planctomycetaceae bacterium]